MKGLLLTLKIEAVTELPRPTAVTEVRTLLGFVSYYRRFILNFSKVPKPLNKPLQNLEGISHQKKRNSKYIGGLNRNKPLRPYKGFALRPLYWHMPILKLCLSFTLMPVVMDWWQCYTKTRMVKGMLQAYASRSLSPSERNYPAHKLDFLALKWAITEKKVS